MDDKVKELLDRIRDTASAAADTAADTARVAGRKAVGAADAANQTARAAGKKAGQMVDVAKLNVQLFDLNGEFNDVLRQLGQVMYDTHRGQGGESADVAGLLERADEVSEKIREVKARISDLRQSRTCPACGASCGKEDKYCRGCGAPL